jgi:hypothetical protein
MGNFRGHVVFADGPCPGAVTLAPSSPPIQISQAVSAKLTNAGETGRTGVRTKINQARAPDDCLACVHTTLQRAMHLLYRDYLGRLRVCGGSTACL